MDLFRKTSSAVPEDNLKPASSVRYKAITYHISNAKNSAFFPDIHKPA